MRFLDAFPWGYLGVGVVGNVLFFLGSCLFVVGARTEFSGSLFVAGSALMLAGSLGNLSRYDWQHRQQQEESVQEEAEEQEAEQQEAAQEETQQEQALQEDADQDSLRG